LLNFNYLPGEGWLAETGGMAWSALGDAAWLYEAGGQDAPAQRRQALEMAALLEERRIAEVRDVVASFESVAVHFDPEHGEMVLDWLKSVPLPTGDSRPKSGKTVEVPVDYGGGDLAEVAALLGMPPDEIVRLHAGADYTVAAVGFAPGFPYLSGLPEALWLPRRATPRRVAAGSVAIAGGQAGIYPFASQGGWHVLGRTALRLFDVANPQAALLRPGDRVKFVPSDSQAVEATPPEEPYRCGELELIFPGPFTTVQDFGRPGWQASGVSPGGAADPVTTEVVNRLVGNPPQAALLECTMSGPVLRFHRAVRVAWLGWADAQSGRPVELLAGEELDLRGKTESFRGYLAVAGGIDTPLVLGSRATDVRAGLCGRPLRAGDRLPLGEAGEGPATGNWRVGWPRVPLAGRVLELRFLPGMQAGWFCAEALEIFRSATFRISPVSDRMGIRLDGPVLERGRTGELLSQPVVAGSVQVPPDGQPIVLMTERQTIGGYPQIAHVISADLPLLARAWPGMELRFREVTLDEAREAWRLLQRDLRTLATGLALR
jgi:KipI family sensor histidine kinase inhibitor